jgi:branched-chain amino acid transport system ATP-binding protein
MNDTSVPPALEVRNVVAGYDSTTVLWDVSLTVAAGKVTALLGPNSAGKTTLLKTVSGLVPATSGTISMHGSDITGWPSHTRAAAGLCHVPEGRGIFRSLTVRENLIMQASGTDTEVALERATEAFPILGRRLAQRSGTLSGGEQQMLALAVAYVREPRLILVDEASLGLAPVVVDAIFGFLEERCAEGASLLMVDQFVHRALAMSSHAYVLRQGGIVFDGGPDELLDSDLFEQYLGAGAA